MNLIEVLRANEKDAEKIEVTGPQLWDAWAEAASASDPSIKLRHTPTYESALDTLMDHIRADSRLDSDHSESDFETFRAGVDFGISLKTAIELELIPPVSELPVSE